MAARYSMVDEVEAMEVIDDGVYHPDLTISSSRRIDSVRILEPVIAGPIDLKTMFYSSWWSGSQKRVCLGIVGLISFGCFCALISLLVGFIKVLNYIGEAERIKESGIFMIPDLENQAGLFVYNMPNNSERLRPTINSYIDQINNHLAAYENQSNVMHVCDDKHQENGCTFNTSWLGTNCTKQNNYGYFDGNPCLLFSLRKLKSWTPDITNEFLTDKNLLSQVSEDRRFQTNYLPLACFTALSSFGSFDQPARTIEGYFHYFPNAGFKTSFIRNESQSYLPPLVFVQLNGLSKMKKLHIKCSLLAKNVNLLHGLRSLTFEYVDGSEDSVLLDE